MHPEKKPLGRIHTLLARGEVQLATTINGDVPEIGLRKGVLEKVQKSDPVPKPK